MLDSAAKVAGIAAVVLLGISLVAGPGIAGIVWLVQLDARVERLEDDVTELRTGVDELRKGQQEILELLRSLTDDVQNVRYGLDHYIHAPDGSAQVPLR